MAAATRVEGGCAGGGGGGSCVTCGHGGQIDTLPDPFAHHARPPLVSMGVRCPIPSSGTRHETASTIDGAVKLDRNEVLRGGEAVGRVVKGEGVTEKLIVGHTEQDPVDKDAGWDRAGDVG